eukprot:CAMPEP_0180823708 /NCGR_PEP_ID=MMETSP1038_2-20121128/72049_1 /TAXON_ID=632150 /ORGANISM="Azadinium spinosum, Strain 3D9" /LENGTH=71 /DNA_ID=CAMNT_0022866057 /DNA_START=54 /DNA_END=266 /DNA_ORIENTATION=-
MPWRPPCCIKAWGPGSRLERAVKLTAAVATATSGAVGTRRCPASEGGARSATTGGGPEAKARHIGAEARGL